MAIPENENSLQQKQEAYLCTWIHRHYTTFGADPPNPALVRDVIKQVKACHSNSPDLDVDLCGLVMNELRLTYGYTSPQDDACDEMDRRDWHIGAEHL